MDAKVSIKLSHYQTIFMLNAVFEKRDNNIRLPNVTGYWVINSVKIITKNMDSKYHKLKLPGLGCNYLNGPLLSLTRRFHIPVFLV